MYSKAEELQNHINTNYPATCILKECSETKHILLDTLIVNKKFRRQDIGNEIMELLTEYADKTDSTITLVLSDVYGSPKLVLENFYRKHGFTMSDSIKQGDTIFESMIRYN